MKRILLAITCLTFSIQPINFITKTCFKVCNDEKKEEQLNNAIKHCVEHRLRVKDLEELIELAPHACIQTDSLNQLLANACRNNNFDLVKFAIEKGANANCRIDGFSIPLLEASAALCKQREPKTEILQLLIQKNASAENFDEKNHYDSRIKLILVENLQLTNTNTYKLFIEFVNKNKKVFEKLNLNTTKNLSAPEKIVKGVGQYVLKQFGFN